MGREIEIKLRIADVAKLRAALKRVGARVVGAGTGRVHEWNTLYDTERQVLRGRDELLRIRVETPTGRDGRRLKGAKGRVILTFKRPVGGDGAAEKSEGLGSKHKIREEIETEVGDAKTLGRIFAGLGMRESFHYEKYRTTFQLAGSKKWAAGLLIELDETPMGTFVELEGPASAIDRAAGALGFSKNEYIVTNYLRLYAEECSRRGEKFGDMVFRKRK